MEREQCLWSTGLPGGCRDRLPEGLQFLAQSALGLQLAQELPDQRQVLAAELPLSSPLFNRNGGLRGRAMLIPPRGFEVREPVDRVGFVEIDHRLLGELLSFVVTGDRERGEDDSRRREDQMLGNGLCRPERLLEQIGRHPQRFTGVVEAFAASRVDGKIARRANVDAGQIADRAIVLRVREPPRQDHSRITRVLAGSGDEQRFDRGDDLLTFGNARLQ
jgi:hypothetical protein